MAISRFLGLIVVIIAFTLLMFAIQYLHFRFLTVNVVFYSSLYDAVFALLLLVGLMAINLITSGWSWFERVQSLAICALLGYAWAISAPTVVDRSLSIYILEKLEQRGGRIKLEAFEGIFQNEYMVEHRLVDVRLTEQQVSGTVTIEDGCVAITPRGETIAAITRFYRQNLLPKNRLLMGELSDDLTDPFRASKQDVDYEC